MRSGHVAARGPPWRVLVLLVLLVGTSLGALPAAAQTPAAPAVCFGEDADRADDADGLVFRCTTEFPGGGNFLQGEDVDIRLENVRVNAQIHVRCLTSCHDTEGKTYVADYAPGATVRFPRDFKLNGQNAVADRAGRYNASWETVVKIGGADVAKGTFNVWLFDRFTSPGLVVQPGERHTLRASGFDEGAQVTLLLQRRVGDAWQTITTPSGGLFTYTGSGYSNYIFGANSWRIPIEEAENASKACPLPEGCYRFVVRGAGKQDETVPFRMGVATLVPQYYNALGNNVDADPVDVTAVERTREVHVGIAFHYPGGNAFQGELFTPARAAVSPVSGEATLRIRVERLNVTGSTPVQDLTARFDPISTRWEARWTIPKDFPVSASEPDARYRIRLLAAADRYGNRVPEVVLANHTVTAATLTPTLQNGFTLLPRTEKANFTYDVRYHNGTPVAPEDLRAPLEGCVARATRGETLACAGNGVDVQRITGAFENGRWVFHVRHARDYPHLDDHRFHFAAEVQDRWGNTLRRVSSAVFDVEPGSPRVELSTISRGREATTLERGGGAGNPVTILATVTYADGSPFTREVNANKSPFIPGVLVKRAGGAVVSERELNLREVDSSSGRWVGDVTLTADATETPLGVWTLRLEVRDNFTVANVNRTSFERTVVGVPLHVDPMRQPYPLVETDTVQQFRFRVLYGDGGDVPRADLLESLQAYVLRHNPSNGSTYGNPVSPRLVPQHDPTTGAYQVEFRVPTNLFSGTYAFVVTGGDRHGNTLAREMRSSPFSTTSKTLERPVLTQPPREVQRGEAATVVFDAREGDVGPHGQGPVLIQVERYDVKEQRWVPERSDARQTAEDLTDHVGLFPATLTTAGGLYRFVMEGRDANLQRITATSNNFSVLPAEVARAILEPPAERVVKGGSITFTIERLDGDRFTEARVLFNGRTQVLVNGQPLPLPAPLLIPGAQSVNVTWEVPYEAPNGNYSLVVGGLDLFGNRIQVSSPSVETLSAQLTGRILGNPARTIARGETASLLFGVTYPQGGRESYYTSAELPTVQVVNASGFVDLAQVRAERLTFVATWTPPADAGADEYQFEVTGAGLGGNAFPALRSTGFRVVPGVVDRAPAVDVGAAVERMGSAVLGVPFDARDRYVEFFLAYFGPGTDASAAVFQNAEPQSRSLLAHTLEPDVGRYTARFVTDHRTTPGVYRILMRGEDGHGNELTSASNPFVLRPTSVSLSIESAPPDEAFGEGKTVSIGVVARYRSGVIMDESMGRPSVVVLYTEPGKAPLPVTVRPDLQFQDGRWVATWTAPAVLPEGLYEFSFGGTDVAGNTLGSVKSRAFVVQTTAAGSAAKLLPAPDAAELLLALAGVALAFAVLKRRRG